jgi:hypothetical protein
MNKNLTMPQKVIKYAQEPVVFHLHKKRNFFHKIDGQIQQDEIDRIQKEKADVLIAENKELIKSKIEKDAKKKMKAFLKENMLPSNQTLPGHLNIIRDAENTENVDQEHYIHDT